jgi:chemotaxis protein methyltransferase CheR
MLTAAEFNLIAREVKARSGAALKAETNGMVYLRLQHLARREGFSSVAEMISAANLRADGSLWRSVTEALAQQDTRFFHDREHFARLRSEVLPTALMRRGHERVRIWSAGCSTGQEAYSIAMMIEEMRADGLNPAVEIVATDFSQPLIEKARSGLYTQFEVQRGLPIRTLIRHFERSGDLWRINDRLRAAIRFETQSLLEHPGALGRFDLIVLAHVLSAFDHETQLGVLEGVADALRPDGLLMLGAGEALPEGFGRFALSDGFARFADAERVAA